MANLADRLRSFVTWLREKVSPRVPDKPTTPRALAVMEEGPSRDELQSVFHDAGWNLEIADDSASASARVESERFPIILYERDAKGTGWRQAVAYFSRLSPRPCVVLLSRTSDKNLWDELVRCGGFELLRLPVERDAVLRTINAGWSIWRSQHWPHRRTAKDGF